MKCDNCKHKKYHGADSWWAVADGNNDPYNYEYCNRGYWSGDYTEPQDENAVGMEDQFINCEDYNDLTLKE